ncbi:MAG TPA: nucleotidyltransferase domain-containing protein [Stellaceae bacterium]|nr:nucleotidyltransferase domain-containing protein [Stellaceae bacterium]
MPSESLKPRIVNRDAAEALRPFGKSNDPGLMREARVPSVAAADAILKRFRAALDELYGDRIERVVLFGSRARGEAHSQSDYDVAVFLHDFNDLSAEINRLADIETDMLYDSGVVINALPLPAGSYRDRTGFMHELRRDGVDL